MSEPARARIEDDIARVFHVAVAWLVCGACTFLDLDGALPSYVEGVGREEGRAIAAVAVTLSLLVATGISVTTYLAFRKRALRSRRTTGDALTQGGAVSTAEGALTVEGGASGPALAP